MKYQSWGSGKGKHRNAGDQPAGRTRNTPALVATLGAALIVLGNSAPTTAQVAPMGAHNMTLGEGNGVLSSVSPTGGMAASVPITLPSARGGIPLPLSINYTAASRIGAGGAGWDIPLSYVRMSTSAMRRKPAIGNTGAAPTQVPMRLMVSLGGATMIMVPRSDNLVWVPTVADSYQELAAVPEGWELRTSAGLIYTFEPARTIATRGCPSCAPTTSLGDPLVMGADAPADVSLVDENLWLLTRITDAGAHDRVDLEYAMHGGPGRSPTLDLRVLRYGVNAAGSPMHQVTIEYGGWKWLAATNGREILAKHTEEGYTVRRDRIVYRVTVASTNNLVAGSPLRRIRAYDLGYQRDPDTDAPRLATVDVRGEEGAASDSSLPLARYTYGASSHAATDQTGMVVTYGAELPIARRYAFPGLGTNLALTEVTRDTALVLWPGTVETTRSRHVIRDFTGDGVPDLVFREGQDAQARWHLLPGHVGLDGVAAFDGPDYTWTDFPEISEQLTYIPDMADAMGDGDNSGDRSLRQKAITTMTYVEFLDWNGDGRMDVVDARNGIDADHWRVWINQGVTGTSVTWRPLNISIASVKSHLASNGIATLSELVPSGAIPYGTSRLPIERSRTWNRTITTHRLYYTGQDYPDNYTGQSDTIVEWNLSDQNGDGFPDLHLLDRRVIECELDAAQEPAYQSGARCDETPARWLKTHLETLAIDVCPATYKVKAECINTELGTWSPAPQNEKPESDAYTALLNVSGALDPGAGPTFVPRPDGDYSGAGSAGWWTSSSANPFEHVSPGPNFETHNSAPIDGDGLSVEVGAPSITAWQASGSLNLDGAQYVSDRSTKCFESDSTSITYTSRQIAGYVDLNGDGIPDWVSQTCADGSACPSRDYGTGPWTVKFGDGSAPAKNLAVSRTILGEFELSVTTGTCAGATTTTAGLLDVDGDGKPEVVRIVSNVMMAKSIQTADGVAGGLDPQRLVSITNGDGAITSVVYANNKANGQSSAAHSLPFPEIVVAKLSTTLPSGGGDPVAPVLYAYGTARLRYDPYFARWVFPGYQRQVAATGVTTAEGLVGTTVVSDRSPVGAATSTWLGLALDGRPMQTSTLEGTAPSDLRSLLDADVNADPRLRGQTQLIWSGLPLPTSTTTTSTDECFGSNALAGTWPQGDPALCQAAGIVYLLSQTTWTGTHAPPATDNVTTARFVTGIDSIGRITEAQDAGDTRRTSDDVCRVTTFATPPSGDRVTTAIKSERLTDCGWGHPTTNTTTPLPGPPVTIAGVRFAYDGLTEGSVTQGRLTQRITERYDVQSGTWLGQSIDTFDHDEVGNVRLILRNRAIGVAATQSIFLTYDPWAATATSVTTIATGAAATVEWRSASTWPSVPEVTTSANGEVTSTAHDRFGRPNRSTVQTASGTRYLIGVAAYDDTPGARQVTATAYLGDVLDNGSAASGPSTRTTTRLDALGRPVVSWTERGADYPGVLVDSWTHYDQLGRVVYSADPFAAAAVPSWTGPGNVDGISVVYDSAGRTLSEIRARQQIVGATTTDRSTDRFVTSNAYAWQGGRFVVTTRDADANDPTSPRYGLQGSAQVATTATGLVEDRTRYQSTTPIDRVTQFYDRLGQMTRLRRYGDPATATQPVDWDGSYDSLGLRLTSTEPGQSLTTSVYDDWGEVLSSTWTDGAAQRIWRAEYDGLGRPTRRKLVTATPPLETVESDETLTYDQVTNSALQAPGPFLGRLSSSTVAGAASVYYGYDALGRVAMESWLRAGETKPWTTRPTTTAGGLGVALDYETPDSKDRAQYTYDSAGQVRVVAFGPTGSLAQVWKAETVDALGRYRSVLLGNGAREQFVFRDIGRRELTEWSATGADGKLIRRPGTFDALGRATVIDEISTVPGQGTITSQSTYGYDLLGRMTSAKTTGPASVAMDDSYAYDALGNMTAHSDHLVSANSQTFRRDATDLDRACWIGALGGGAGSPCNVGYDGGGNITAQGSGSTARTFTYDAASRLTRVTSGVNQQAITYGPGGSPLTEVVTKSGATVREIRHYGSRLSWQKNTSKDTFDERVVSGPLGPIALARGSGAARNTIYVHGDGQGNRLFTGKNGAVVQSNRFAPFGAVKMPTGVPGAITYSDALWNGGEQADVFGIDLLGARAYDPALGRFLQRDPLVTLATASHAHPYAFAWSDPVNHSDPSGLSPPGDGPCDELNATCGSGSVEVTAGGSVSLGDGLQPGSPTMPTAPSTSPPTATPPGDWNWSKPPPARFVEGAAADAAATEAATAAAVETGAASWVAAVMGGVQALGPGTAIGGMGALQFTRMSSLAQYGNAYGVPHPGLEILARVQPQPQPDDQTNRRRRRWGRIYVTYTKYEYSTGQYYSGRTSSVVDLTLPLAPQALHAIEMRDQNHHIDEDDEPTGPSFGAAQLDRFDVGNAVSYANRYRDQAYLRIRGREQQLIDYHGGARSDTGTPFRTPNRVRGVAKDNPMGPLFDSLSTMAWGKLPRYDAR